MTLKQVSSQMEADVAAMERDVKALVSEKNKLGVADAKGSERLENMDKDLGFENGPQVVVLQTGQATRRGEEDTKGKTKEKRLKAKLMEEKETEKLTSKVEEEEDEEDTKGHPYGVPKDGSVALTPIVNVTLSNVSESID